MQLRHRIFPGAYSHMSCTCQFSHFQLPVVFVGIGEHSCWLPLGSISQLLQSITCIEIVEFSAWQRIKEERWGDGVCRFIYQRMMKEATAHDFVLPGLCSPSKQKHLVRPMTMTWAMARNAKAATAYDEETSESYLQ